ncbi:uncharacterized protein N7515_003415 [Penicillium bovifimosum]|uniref:Uncharacterized protein n=1 Tax=Penicillium bovifimosum TaxID=126998 RepID=A0A9W9L677_9EURO|nr:uncharacterized protein N7515_003415 [Penicillium bovifimosum]KAJ5138567.1 hypothetical protein N7515_003415 [Penicillium bovifimosum]
MSSVFWLAGLDGLVTAINSPDFTVRDEVTYIPDNASIRSMLPLLSEEGKIPGAVYRNYCGPAPDVSMIAFPLRDFTIPASVTGSAVSFRSVASRASPSRFSLPGSSKSGQAMPAETSNGDSSALWGAIYSSAAYLDQHSLAPWHGPGIYTTPPLERAGAPQALCQSRCEGKAQLHIAPRMDAASSRPYDLNYKGAQGALMVFRRPDFHRVSVWDPSGDEWAVIAAYWTGRILSNAQAEFLLAGPAISSGVRCLGLERVGEQVLFDVYLAWSLRSSARRDLPAPILSVDVPAHSGSRNKKWMPRGAGLCLIVTTEDIPDLSKGFTCDIVKRPSGNDTTVSSTQ